MSRVLSITRASTYDRRRALILDADNRQESIVGSVLSSGFEFDWTAILEDLTHDPLPAINRRIEEQLASDEFLATTSAIELNAKLLATWTQKRTEEIAGIRAPELALTFAEPAVFTPTRAVAYWQRILGLTDQQAIKIMERVAKIYARAPDISRAIMDKVTELYSRTISEGVSLPEFIAEVREVLPAASKHILETEYRTFLSDTYVGATHEMVIERKATFPFTQWMSTGDTRRCVICFAMGTAVGGRGYIAATDDAIWIKWRPPAHYRDRCKVSPISYLEARRIGILAKDGRTKLAIIGNNPNRPYGDPPDFATDPFTGNIVAVEPQEGFGG